MAASAYLIYIVVKRSNDRTTEGRPATVLEQYEVGLSGYLKVSLSRAAPRYKISLLLFDAHNIRRFTTIEKIL